ncbi:MAG: amidophosphoribosyltransferase, partial [Opitutales bacterium]|nr:amidophosphoribosyltransferase [Opitutales bacterium]
DIGKFIAFQAAVNLAKERGLKELLREVYQLCFEQSHKDPREMKNYVKMIYEPFSDEEISRKVADMVYPQNVSWNGELEVVFQSVENLHKSITSCTGDWFFTGDYPTPGGFKVVNRAFMNYYEKKEGRAY